MKFLALAALIATATAAVGDDCGPDGSNGECEETECCGTATPDEDSAAEEAIQVCQTEELDTYVDADDEEMTYNFACDDSALKLLASASIAMTAAYLM